MSETKKTTSEILESKKTGSPKGTVEVIEGANEATNLPAIPDARTLRSSLGITPNDMLELVRSETTEGLDLDGLLSRASQSSRLTDELDKYDAVFYWRLGRDLVVAREQCTHGKWGNLLKSRRISDWKWNQAKILYTRFPDPLVIADKTLSSLLTEIGVYKADRFDKALPSEKPEATTSEVGPGTLPQAPGTMTSGGMPSPMIHAPASAFVPTPPAGTPSARSPSSMKSSHAQVGEAKIKPERDNRQVGGECGDVGEQEPVAGGSRSGSPAVDRNEAHPPNLPSEEATPPQVDFRPPPPEFDLPLELYQAVEWLRRASIWLAWVSENSVPPGGEGNLSTHRRFLEVIDEWRRCRLHPANVTRAS